MQFKGFMQLGKKVIKCKRADFVARATGEDWRYQESTFYTQFLKENYGF